MLANKPEIFVWKKEDNEGKQNPPPPSLLHLAAIWPGPAEKQCANRRSTGSRNEYFLKRLVPKPNWKIQKICSIPGSKTTKLT